MRFTQADKDYFTAVRREDPAVDQLFRDVRQMIEAFPGSKIVHLTVRDSEWGKPMPEGVPYVRVEPLPRPAKIRNGTKQQLSAQTVAQRRRSMTKYKGDPQ